MINYSLMLIVGSAHSGGDVVGRVHGWRQALQEVNLAGMLLHIHNRSVPIGD
jgi:hypothetical protein